MGYRTISRDVKIAAINLYLHGRLSLQEILNCVGFSERTFYRILELWRTTGDVVTYKKSTGRPRKLHHNDVQYLLRLVNHSPDWFLDELGLLLKNNRFISVHYTTIHRELANRVGVSLKQLTRIATERNEPSRNDFVREASQYPPEYIGFLDETSKNDKTPARRRGRAKKGKRAIKKQKFVRGPRATAIGFLTLDGITASMVVEGSMKRVDYLEFLEYHVVRSIARTEVHCPNPTLASEMLAISRPAECACDG
ncbi:hypothetical protein DFH06DRAFT_1275025 [Mycena polygramma]|nr:hypothetical protein DFH06DRAFT_1275025 [Mycena polygramma]